jgi:hypothetical protein
VSLRLAREEEYLGKYAAPGFSEGRTVPVGRHLIGIHPDDSPCLKKGVTLSPLHLRPVNPDTELTLPKARTNQPPDRTLASSVEELLYLTHGVSLDLAVNRGPFWIPRLTKMLRLSELPLVGANGFIYPS